MRRPNILIVEDEQEVLRSLSIMLEDEGHVLTASNGFEALKIICSNPLSMIILDLNMPAMSGTELLECIRAKNSRIPILILTGCSSHDAAKKCADLNVQGYFEKPVDIERLIERIRKLIWTEGFELFHQLCKDSAESKSIIISPTIKKAISYLRERYFKDVNRDELAAYLNLCPNYLSRQFRKECGVYITEYVNMLRIYKSMEYLADTTRKSSDVAYMVGFANSNYFCRLFKKYTGLSPREFREKHTSVS